MTRATILAFFILFAHTALATYVDQSASGEDVGTFSFTNLAYGAIGLFAVMLAVVALLWKCVVSPAVDLSWDTVTAGGWIIVISALLCFFTVMLWFIT